MEINIKWFGDSFNIGLASKAGAEEFLSIKGCRLKTHEGKEFVSFPSTKNQQTGKYWNHCYGSDKFQAAVIEKAKAAKPEAQARNPRDPSNINDDIPF